MTPHQFFNTVAATTKLTGESVDAGPAELSESGREAAVRRARSPRARPFPIHAWVTRPDEDRDE